MDSVLVRLILFTLALANRSDGATSSAVTLIERRFWPSLVSHSSCAARPQTMTAVP